ncbi:hypothetical protein [uncultured Sphingomonas sp.]|jgi:hypothetical protein|nr:hypothetical protein [uncultured Sphingomonas sp.]
MYENPLTKLSDDQIEHAIDEALARNDSPFLGELVGEIARRGQPVEL